MRRRAFLAALAAGCALPAGAHTPYGQWVVYRQKHLLVGCHREDPRTYELAQALVAEFEHGLPEARARVARARLPERLASLIGTDQLEMAVLALGDAEAIAEGRGRFRPYGAVGLRALGAIRDRLLVVDEDFPARHAWQVAAALDDGMLAGRHRDAGTIGWHPGASAWRDGQPPPPRD